MDLHTLRWVVIAALAGCGPSQPPRQPPPTRDSAAGTPERKALAPAACEAQGGSAVGDIGDGATHRPDYVCPSGKPPLGDIAPPAHGPIPVEGAVCCPR
jgi:hypothetical protein